MLVESHPSQIESLPGILTRGRVPLSGVLPGRTSPHEVARGLPASAARTTAIPPNVGGADCHNLNGYRATTLRRRRPGGSLSQSVCCRHVVCTGASGRTSPATVRFGEAFAESFQSASQSEPARARIISLSPDPSALIQNEVGTLAGLDWSNANLEGADLRDQECARIILRNATLIRADLRGANLQGADLKAADLTGADLTGADLTGADLEGANLRLAHLVEARLTQANMRWCHLAGAKLKEADLTDTHLKGAVADASTQWPDGFDVEAAGIWRTD